MWLLASWLTVSVWSCSKQRPNAGQNEGAGYQSVSLPEQSTTPRTALALTPALSETLLTILPDSLVKAVTGHVKQPKGNPKPVLSVYPLDIEQLIVLRPDVVFTEQGMTAPQDIERMQQLGFKVIVQKYDSLEHIWQGIREIGDSCFLPDKAHYIADSLGQITQQLYRQAAKSRAEYKPTAIVLIQVLPTYVFGYKTLVSEMLHLAGFTQAVPENYAGPGPVLEAEEWLTLDPDYILGSSSKKVNESLLTAKPVLKRLQAIDENHVYDLNSDWLTRPGINTLKSVEEMQKILSK